MKRENQVCTPAQAKKLKDFGIVNTEYYYSVPDKGKTKLLTPAEVEDNENQKICPAISMPELFEVLPTALTVIPTETGYAVRPSGYKVEHRGVKLAEALTDTLLYMLSHKYLTASKVNKLLKDC